jgi:hypothetical protein
MMDPTQIISAAMAILGPYMPSLIKMGKSALEGVSQETFKEWGKDLGNSSWQAAHSVWDKLSGATSSKPETVEAFASLSQPSGSDCELQDRMDEFMLQLRKELRSDPSRSMELERIIISEAGTSSAHAEGAGSVAIGRDAHQSVIITSGGTPKH